jgi:hypothetical protein
MPFGSRKPGYASYSSRIYAPKPIINWWRSLDNDQRGEALKILLELKPELINATNAAVTWKRAD